jgi:hypothetical protein
MSSLAPEERDEAGRACEFPLLWAPLLALLPDYRVRALKRAHAMFDLVDEAWRLCGGTRRSQRGLELMSAIASAAIDRDMFFEGVEALDADAYDDGALALFARAAAPAVAGPVSAPPVPKAMPEARQPEAVRKWMLRAHQHERAVRVKVGSRESTVYVTGVRTQGQETLFLVVDTETDEGRALRLDSIASVSFVDQPAR